MRMGASCLAIGPCPEGSHVPHGYDSQAAPIIAAVGVFVGAVVTLAVLLGGFPPNFGILRSAASQVFQVCVDA